MERLQCARLWEVNHNGLGGSEPFFLPVVSEGYILGGNRERLQCERLQCGRLQCERLQCERLQCERLPCERLQCARLREANDNGLRELGTHSPVLSRGYNEEATMWEATA